MHRSFTITRRVLAPLALSLPLFVGAQEKKPFDALSDAMHDKVLPFEKVERTGHLADCSLADVPTLEGLAAQQGVYTQYIFNATYRWATIPYGNGGDMCIFLEMPEKRGLSREDARMLLSAHDARFDVPVDTQATVPPPADNVQWKTDDHFYVDDKGKPN